jgi:hypothetical protein
MVSFRLGESVAREVVVDAEDARRCPTMMTAAPTWTAASMEAA